MPSSLILFICLSLLNILATSCATQLRAPLNRLNSPQTVGGNLNSEFVLSSASLVEGVVDLSGTEPYGLQLSQKQANTYAAALAIAESVDLTWSHAASAPSMVGIKWQAIGTSKQQAGAGHALAIALAFGGNQHEIKDSPRVEFEVSSTDASVIHGYWLGPNVLLFDSVSYSSHAFDGDVSGFGRFSEQGTFLTGAAGVGFVFRPVELKTELAYTQVDWSEAGAESYLSWGLSLGLSF